MDILLLILQLTMTGSDQPKPVVEKPAVVETVTQTSQPEAPVAKAGN